MSDESDLDDILNHREARDDSASAPLLPAFGRVAKDPLYVLNEGEANGITLECMVTSGPATGTTVQALAMGPLGAGFRSQPIIEGMRVLLCFMDGRVDGCVVAIGSVPGGYENPIPKAIAGVKVSENGLQQTEVHAPPKGVGVREYIRGGQYVIRLKGDGKATNPDGTPFVAEFFVEGDDGPPGSNTSIAMAWDPNGASLGVKIRHSSGAFAQVAQGAVTLQSANGENRIEVTDDGVTIMGTVVTLAADKLCDIHGGNVLLNMPPLTPPVPGVTSVALGPGSPLNLFSTTVHCGP
jgi:hypothetical protein